MKEQKGIPAKYTVADYEKLEEGAPYILLNGQLVEEPAPEYGHQDLSGEIFNQIFNHLKKHPLGKVLDAPLDVYFDDHNVFQPDIVYISNRNKDIVKEKKKVKGAPDLIIEIISPYNAHHDWVEKKVIYEMHGVKEYWIIDPDEKQATGYALIDGKYIQTHKNRDSFYSKLLGLKLVLKVRDFEEKFTVEDYERLKQETSIILLNGQVIEKATPDFRQRELSGEIFYQISTHVKKHRIGKVFSAPGNVYFDNENVLQPDIIFISNHNKDILGVDGKIHGAPDLIIEILSLSTDKGLTDRKIKIFEKHRVKEYWIIDISTNLVKGFGLQDGKLTSQFETKSFFYSKLLNLNVRI